jgi:hypothetical protein
MIDSTTLLYAIRQSGVTSIAIIDDAFDAPEINDDSAGPLLEFLEGDGFESIRAEVDIHGEAHRRALEALRETDYDSEDLMSFVDLLYSRFLTTFDRRFDPGGMFESDKGDNLNYLKPILTLLGNCGPQLNVVRVGSKVEDLRRLAPETHLIFVDFYLDPSLAAGEAPKGRRKTEAKAASLARLTSLLRTQAEQAPSVILMSSHQVKAEAERYRAALNKGRSRVFASRFTFIEKTELELAPNGEIQIGEETADALLDIFQSYEFGRAVHAGLDCWLESAANAVNLLRGEIADLDLKDFAYLVRFRLLQEGQGLFGYLEWFFGECLLDSVGRSVDQAAAADNRINLLNGPAASRIEGAFDGPTKKVAELYHRVRIENPRSSRGDNYRLGDLYLVDENRGRAVVAVMTPDCDLILRDGRRRAPRLLTVAGKLKGFDARDASVSDFVLIRNRPYNISWDKKSIETKNFGEWPASGAPPDGPEFLGTLRPLYAQELQRKMLEDLGRVGVSVAPAIGMTAAVEVFVRRKSGSKEKVEDNRVSGKVCYIVPSRGGSDKPRVIFRRQFVRDLVSVLSEMNPDQLSPIAAGSIVQLKRADAYRRLSKMFRSGVLLAEEVDLGIFVTTSSSSKGSDEGTWCWLVVSMLDLE